MCVCVGQVGGGLGKGPDRNLWPGTLWKAGEESHEDFGKWDCQAKVVGTWD